MTESFRAYIDESGDEGFVFKPDGSGSSRWLVLSAVIVRHQDEELLKAAIDEVESLLNRRSPRPIHFSDLDHIERIPVLRAVAKCPVTSVSVLVDKEALRRRDLFISNRHLLYRYACRYLFERISSYCGSLREHVEGDGYCRSYSPSAGGCRTTTSSSTCEC